MLDFSTNTAFQKLNCVYNLLTSLNVKNGNNVNFTGFDARNNPNLTCIQVDNVPWSKTNWTNKDATARYSTDCNACRVNIPDANFKTALIAISGLDTDGDGEVQCTEAAAFTGAIYVSSKTIADLTGIEAFTKITNLDCSSNLLTTLNVLSNTSLTNLDCYNNQLATLNVNSLTSLSYIDCSDNGFTSLDFSGNTSLTEIYCGSNLLTSINISGLASLIELDLSNNKFTSLDFSGLGLSSLKSINKFEREKQKQSSPDRF